MSADSFSRRHPLEPILEGISREVKESASLLRELEIGLAETRKDVSVAIEQLQSLTRLVRNGEATQPSLVIRVNSLEVRVVELSKELSSLRQPSWREQARWKLTALLIANLAAILGGLAGLLSFVLK